MSQDPILELALLGTERGAQRPSGPLPGEGLAARFVAQLRQSPEPTAALALLRSIAAAGVCARAGFVPPRLDAVATPAPFTETRRAAPIEPLETVLSNGTTRLLHEVFTRMASSGLRIPGPLLRRALDLGARNAALREPLLPVLGERGLWLATQHEGWRYARGQGAGADEETLWSFGALAQRVAVLAHQRETDPAGARARLMADYAQLPPDERAALLGALKTGLSLADEDDLQPLLAERAREPRRAAMALLATLPQSAYSQRMHARLAPLLTRSRGLLGKRWSIEPPLSADDSWKADGLVAEKPKNSPWGDRAWLLLELVAHTAPAWWSEHTGLSPAELVKWAAKTDWAAALMEGWYQAVLECPAKDWPQALHAHAPAKMLDDPRRERLLALLDIQEREAHWSPLLKDDQRFAALTGMVLAGCPVGQPGPGLSRPFSDALVAQLVRLHAAAALQTNYLLMHHLAELCCVLHIDGLAPLLALARGNASQQPLSQPLQQALQAVQCRLALPGWTR